MSGEKAGREVCSRCALVDTPLALWHGWDQQEVLTSSSG